MAGPGLLECILARTAHARASLQGFARNHMCARDAVPSWLCLPCTLCACAGAGACANAARPCF